MSFDLQMPQMRKRMYTSRIPGVGNRKTDERFRPLKPDELHVLRAQYEKEGEYVGIQTKFNYAWACLASP